MILFPLALLLLAACSNEDPPMPARTKAVISVTAVNSQSPTMATPMPMPRPGASTAPQGTRTGDPGLDAILDAIVRRDAEAFATLHVLTETACSTATGHGGPPPCQTGLKENLEDDMPNGTPIRAFPASVCHGAWIVGPDAEVKAGLVSEILPSNPKIYAVIRLTPARRLFEGEPSYPVLTEMILLEIVTQGEPRLGIILGVNNGRVVQRNTVCFGPPEAYFQVLPPFEVILRGPAYQ